MNEVILWAREELAERVRWFRNLKAASDEPQVKQFAEEREKRFQALLDKTLDLDHLKCPVCGGDLEFIITGEASAETMCECEHFMYQVEGEEVSAVFKMHKGEIATQIIQQMGRLSR